MIFDLFHSISDSVVGGNRLGPRRVLDQYFSQAVLAEEIGFETLWLAESHFSSEVQKRTSVATIPEFQGEVGLNADSFQWFHELSRRTKRIGLGTAIHNIVGGSGGPLASADRVQTLSFINQNFWESPRELRIGVASGRFPYQNTPFGLIPRNELETDLWPALRRYAFIEALEIFLRLMKGEELESKSVESQLLTEVELRKTMAREADRLLKKYQFPLAVPKRWNFELMKLVPHQEQREHLHFVLGSADPLALDVGLKHWDLDLFNLSFTPPEEIEKLHTGMSKRAATQNRVWHRSRLPRTVLIFIDPVSQRAHELANRVLDAYIEAMRGTAAVPDKNVLLSRALIGDAEEIRDQLHPDNPRKFHKDDRLMLWFEFNQIDGEAIKKQMKYFHDDVMARL